MVSPEEPKGVRERLRGLWSRWGYAAVGAAFFLFVGLVGTTIVDNRSEARRRVELISFASLVKTRLAHELDAALFLTGGLKSYLVVRDGVLDRREVDAILQKLFDEARHVRNVGVAVGYKLDYLYPLKGNEKVAGFDYRKVPAQLAAVQRVIDGGVPVLLGPMALVQGGTGLVYRAPISLDGKYWGLISTVVDSNSLFADAIKRAAEENLELAIRGKDARGADGDVFLGDAGVFRRKGVELIGMDVPGGKWVIAVRSSPLASTPADV